MARTQIIAEPGDTRIVMRRDFDAPRELLYRAYAEPELLTQWMGPKRLTMRIDEYDLRHGGAYRFVHLDETGNEYRFRGVFHGEPTIDGGLARTFEFEGFPGHVSFERATFTEVDGRTTVESISVFTTVEDRDGMVASGMETGVEEGYERLDDLLARERPGRGRLTMDWKLEVVVVPVSDVDRAKAFYVDQVGFVLDVDHQPNEHFRVVQMTPRGSGCSVTVGIGLSKAVPGPVKGLQLVVSDIAAAHAHLVERGVDVTPIRHFEDGEMRDGPGGPWNSFVFFDDPDGNSWAVQEKPTEG